MQRALSIALAVVFLGLSSRMTGTPAAGRGTASDSSRSPHGPLAVPCQNCHTQAGWKPIRSIPEFDHSKTKYPLRGLHTNVPCMSCHTKPVFTNVGTKCADCHANIHRGQMGANCESCHTVKGWKADISAIQNHQNRFPLVGAHAMVECDSCHKGAATGQFKGLSTDCYTCHAQQFQQAKAPDHVAAKFPTDCSVCHSINSWAGATFDHAKFAGIPCVTCHLLNYQTALSPLNHVALNLPQTCQNCHTTVAWQPATFDHSMTGFPLTGKHATTACAMCHISNNYNLTTTSCVGCHQADYNRAKTPVDHIALGLPTTCEACHSTTDWSGATFDHSKTGFPLTGAHAPLQCALCHINNNYKLTSTACVTCHQAAYDNAKTPVNHVALGFPTTCENCHDDVLWTNGKFDHASTGWALTGKHAATPCAQCHVNNNYKLTDTSCVACHQTDYNTAKTPVDHVALKYPTTCEGCHDTTLWTNATFNHASTGFTLTGAHVTLQCAQCHINNNYNLTTAACVSCHQAAYDGAKTPIDHVGLNFPTTCEGCHDTVLWTDGKFDHTSTGFPLTGKHATTPCTLCHINNNYKLTNTACVTCHQTDYNNAKTPIDHVALGFPTTCESCHDTVLWTDGKFDHATTGWALTGKHAVTPCALCHVNNNYQLTSTACVTCHQNDYNGAKTPIDHVALGFPTTCAGCHDTVLWTDGKFDHSATGWALTGFHATTPCVQCHVNNNYNLTSTTCVTCHQTDYNNAKTPIDHIASGFPTTCENCHDTVLWTNGKFDHATTGWPLTGFHATLTCAQCHVNGNYKITTTACVSCHQTDYNNAKTPINHVALGFPTTCESCHDTVLWTDGKFDHASTGWALTGFHATTPCALCHVNNNYNLTNTACVACHQTDYNNAKTPVDHIAAGFPTTCQTCHDTVLWVDGRFDHATTGWPLTGFHATSVTCAQCHINGNYSITNTACISCHQTDYNNTTNPNHAAAGFPTTCQTCHSTTNWLGAVFNHTYFPQNHGGASTCNTCHTNPSNYLIFSCLGCHEHADKNQVDGNHQGVNGYVYDSVHCYQCHKN